MKKISVPQSNRTRALVVVDMQEGFLKQQKDRMVIALKRLVEQEEYNLYIEVDFYAEPGSLWDLQDNWIFPYQPTIPEVKELLKDKNSIHITKQTRSAFKGDGNLENLLRNHGIEEIHVVGVDSSDCVFATVQEGFDLGFFSYVIEECTCSSQGEEMHTKALYILRRLGLTNHTKQENI